MHETAVLVSSGGEKVSFYAKRGSLMFRNQKPCLWAVGELQGNEKTSFLSFACSSNWVVRSGLDTESFPKEHVL